MERHISIGEYSHKVTATHICNEMGCEKLEQVPVLGDGNTKQLAEVDTVARDLEAKRANGTGR